MQFEARALQMIVQVDREAAINISEYSRNTLALNIRRGYEQVKPH